MVISTLDLFLTIEEYFRICASMFHIDNQYLFFFVIRRSIEKNNEPSLLYGGLFTKYKLIVNAHLFSALQKQEPFGKNIMNRLRCFSNIGPQYPDSRYREFNHNQIPVGVTLPF